MTWVVMQALATPCRDGVGVVECFIYRACGRWHHVESFEETLWGLMAAALAIRTLPVWVVLERTLFAPVCPAPTLPTPSTLGFVMQLRHFKGTLGA